MEILRWQIGDATVFRIAELDATAALQSLVPKFDLADLSRDAWLIPNFVDENRRLRGLVQAFLIIIADQKIVVDPGVGNGKKRVAVPGWDKLQTNFERNRRPARRFLRLRAAGLSSRACRSGGR